MTNARSLLVFDTLLPSGVNPLIKAGFLETGGKAFLEDFAKTTVFSMRLGVRAALFAAIWLAPLLSGRLLPLFAYSRETREEILSGMSKSRFYLVRQMLLLLKATAGFHFGTVPAVRDAIGFPQSTNPTGRV